MQHINNHSLNKQKQKRMLKTIAGLQGVTIMSKDAQKKVTGKGGCGVYIAGMGGWIHVNDTDGDGRTLDQVNELRSHFPSMRWCCDSCPWNQ
jgi:hypothetical protein